MKIAVIVPSKDLEKFESYGDVCMALAQIVIKDKKYAAYYRNQSEKGRFVILDNGAFEEQESMGRGYGADLVLKAAEMIVPSEVICTDILFEGKATIESTMNFITEVKKKYNSIPYQLMAVPQGKTYEEWCMCFKALVRIPEISTIGLSKLGVPNSLLGEFKSSGNAARSRIMLIKKLCKDCLKELAYMGSTKKQFHCLGSDNWGGYEIRSHVQTNRILRKQLEIDYDLIRSIDTSMMWMYSMYNKVLNIEGKIDDIILEKPPLEMGSYLDYVDKNESPEEQSIQAQEIIKNVFKNICMMHKLSKR